MKKNETVVVTIEDMGVDGEGIGKANGYTLFVKDAIIGDTVEAQVTKVKKTYAYARVRGIQKASPFRVQAKCKVARQCGGCQIQELSYKAQLEFKQKKVYGNFKRIGGFPKEVLSRVMEPICGMDEPFHYRNKAQFPVGRGRDGEILTGFYAGRTHQIIPNTDCAIGVPENREILRIIKDFMEEYAITPHDEATGGGLVRHVMTRYGFATGEIMVCLVINGTDIPHADKLVQRLCGIPGMTSIVVSVNREKTNVIMGRKVHVLWGQGYITDCVGGVRYRISPLSFYQVNPAQTEVLYRLTRDYAGLTGRETVWDLYCGIGTISLFLAKDAKRVYGVEAVPEAVQDARENAGINGIRNAEFYAGKAEEFVPEYFDRYQMEHGVKPRADVFVLDPPRKGCDEALLDAIAEAGPKRIVYVSCDSATLARDLKYLCGRGYKLVRARPVDMFPMTVSVETVCLLSQQKPDDVIRVSLDLNELEVTPAETKSTYGEIKAYVKEHTGLAVSSLYIAQVKQKYGIIERENYNKPKSEGARGPVDLCSAPTNSP